MEVMLVVFILLLCLFDTSLGKDKDPYPLKHFATQMEVEYELPKGLLVAICGQESDWRNVPGAAGEQGICQIKPSTLRMLCKRCDLSILWTPQHNIRWAAVYLSWIRNNVSAEPYIMAAAYNGGHANPSVKYMVGIERRRNEQKVAF